MSRGIARLRRARTLVTLVCVVPLVALVPLALNGEYQQGLAQASAQSGRPVVLDVALVNEDRGTGVGDDQVNLGRAYVTQVEGSTTAAWDVLSRGVAERGLAAGAYHLVVVIPGEFSETLLDLGSDDPSPITVSYQVNGKGDVRVEAAATQRGREIVSDLNGQLVDMYVASILGDLRQAQDGVRVVVESEAEHVLAFTEEVDPAVRALGTSLEVLTGTTDGSVATSDDLVAGLDALRLDQQDAAQDLADHDASVAGLVAARAEGAITYETFMQALLAMDSRLLSEEVDALALDLSSTGESLEQQLAEQPDVPNHAAAVTALQVAVAAVGTSTAERAAALDALSPGTVLTEQDAGEVLAGLGLDREGGVTLADLVALAGGLADLGGPGPELPPAAVLAVLGAATAAQVARLPYLDDAALTEAHVDALFGHAGEGVERLTDELAEDLATVRGWDGFGEVVVGPDGVVGSDLGDLARTLDAARAEVSALTVDPDPDPGPGPAEADAAIDGLVTAAAEYGVRVTQIADAYHRAVGLVALVGECEQTCGLHPGTVVTDAVDAVIRQSVLRQRDAEREHLARAADLAATLDAAAADVAGTTESLRRTAQQLTTRITAQLDELSRMREAMRQVLDEERTAARSTADAGSRVQLVVGEARAARSTGEQLAVSALARAEGARRVTELLAALRSDVTGLLDDAAALDERSARLTTALTGQADVSAELAESFGGVLPNAHSAGVLNERLVRFLVAPVAPGQRDAVSTIDVTRPFPWVLITFTLCLTSAAVLAGRRRPTTEPTSVFARRDGAWLRSNARLLGISAAVGAALGAVLTWASARSLDVPRESQVVWAASMVLICLGLTLLCRWLVVQLRAAGVGLCVVLLVGYVFVSDAVGTGAGSGPSRAVSAINPLSRAETVLTSVLGADAPGTAVLGPLVVTVLVAVVANLLVLDDPSRPATPRWRAVPA